MIRLRIKEIAQAKGISQGKLSRMSDIDDNTIKRIYRNPMANVNNDTLNKLARALEVSIHDLIEEVPDESGGDQR